MKSAMSWFALFGICGLLLGETAGEACKADGSSSADCTCNGANVTDSSGAPDFTCQDDAKICWHLDDKRDLECKYRHQGGYYCKDTDAWARSKYGEEPTKYLTSFNDEALSTTGNKGLSQCPGGGCDMVPGGSTDENCYCTCITGGNTCCKYSFSEGGVTKYGCVSSHANDFKTSKEEAGTPVTTVPGFEEVCWRDSGGDGDHDDHDDHGHDDDDDDSGSGSGADASSETSSAGSSSPVEEPVQKVYTLSTKVAFIEALSDTEQLTVKNSYCTSVKATLTSNETKAATLCTIATADRRARRKLLAVSYTLTSTTTVDEDVPVNIGSDIVAKIKKAFIEDAAVTKANGDVALTTDSLIVTPVTTETKRDGVSFNAAPSTQPYWMVVSIVVALAFW